MQQTDRWVNLSKLLRHLLVFLRRFIPAVVILFFVWFILGFLKEISWGRLVVNWDLALGYIQAMVWPVVVLAVFLTFKKELVALLGRMKRAMWRNAALEFEPTAEQQNPPQAPPDLQNAVASSGATSTQFAPTAQEVLSRTDVQLLFERIYRIMFGTQLDAMKRLQAYPDGLKASDFSDIYDKHKSVAPNPRPSLVDLMSFLVSSSLVSYSSQDGIYKLLPAGDLFLKYFKEQEWLDVPKSF